MSENSLKTARGGSRVAPNADDRLGAAMLADAALCGLYAGPVPIVGRRRALRPGTVARIAKLAREGHDLPAIAHMMQCSRSNVRRYAKDYGISIRKGESGPKIDGVIAQRTNERIEECRKLIEAGCDVAKVAKAMKVSEHTARKYMKRCRDVFEVKLPSYGWSG